VNNQSFDNVTKVFTEVFGPGDPSPEIKGVRYFQPLPQICDHLTVDSQVSISIVVICDIRVLVEKAGDKWAFPSSFFVPKEETTQQTASRILFSVTEEELDPKKWLPVDIRSHPGRKDPKNGVFSLDIGYASILEISDVPLIDTERFSWAVVDFDTGKFTLPLVEDHDQLWEAAFGVFNILLKS